MRTYTGPNRPLTLTEALLREIRDSDLSYHEIEARSGVNRQSVARFYSGQQALHLPAADKLARFFGISVQPARAGSRKRA